MTTYVLYDIASGKDISSSAAPIPNKNPARAVKEFPGKYAPGEWDAKNLIYKTKAVRRVISLPNFFERFNEPNELDNLFEAAKTHRKANTFIQMLKLTGYVDLDDAFIVAHVNLMEQYNVIGDGRAAVILA